ncbi:MAG: hypothetical protein IJC32_04630 [Clostridia bacterium]|nr:hypothetical protein [Clostridia bacterium]
MNKQPVSIDSLGFADIHCHMLAKVDDGPQTAEEMTRMARLARDTGTDVICFTPHSGVFGQDLDAEYLKATFAQAVLRLREDFPTMRFYLGSELFYSCDIPEKLQKGSYLPINGSRYVLVEFLPSADLFNIKNGIKFITMAGYVPILAHVERYKAIYPNRDIIKNLKKMGAVIQVNSRHVAERNLFGANKCKPLLRDGLVDIIASDCHNTENRSPDMQNCYEYLCQNFGKKYADTLMKINPRLILANKKLPKLPF